MPGDRSKNKPSAADELSANEESQLELHLQRQLEEDVARIFDESIFSDLEVVCGKLKILTHSCILKARTKKFFHKLHTILHVNIERSSFDEIYSFISDVYTECNIKNEEKEIISYLDHNLKTKAELDEADVFLTPKCITPYVEKDVQKVINSSPSTELTKEYYALVPIEGNILDKELNEQDALSNAFHSIIKTQEDTHQAKLVQRSKPTSLSLTSSHTSKTVKHSSSCDILNKASLKDNVSTKQHKKIDTVADQDSKTNQITLNDTSSKHINDSDLITVKSLEAPYSPDSLITDEPSSSSDYLSAAYTCSPGVSSSGYLAQVNVGATNTCKMDQTYTFSDSGLEDTGMLGSINSHKDVTVTNVSLSENTLHDLIADDASMSAVSLQSSTNDVNNLQRSKHSANAFENDCNGQTPNSSLIEMSGKSLKEEKQRQNEEIVILESSSLSSETGSWESVYPPKFADKEICEKFLINERKHWTEEGPVNQPVERSFSPTLVKKSPFKSTSCFIDALSLADEDETINVENISIEPPPAVAAKLDILPAPSEPVPCSTAKADISPVDWSERSNENEDSLEQGSKKDPDSIQKDLSPTIFEMTPITEDSLCTNAFETATQDDNNYTHDESLKDRSLPSSTVFMSSTPHNSIMSLKTFKQYESEDSESLHTVVDSDGVFVRKSRKGSNSPPIVSGGVSVEDHLPQVGSHESSPLPKFKLENVPIVTGAYLPQASENTGQSKSRTNSASAWVVDMSSDTNTDDNSSKQSEENVSTEKKNIFSMYIDLGEKSTLKEMPARLSSSISKKNNSAADTKSTPKNSRPALLNTSTSVKKSHDVSIFEKYETLCNDPNISISEIIALPEKTEVHDSFDESLDISNAKGKQPRSFTTKDNILTSTREEHSERNEPEEESFVKLSDLDKPVKTDIVLAEDPKEVDMRMTRSIPDNNWCDQPFSNNSRSIEVISSFHSENALSLNRLFPHLKNEFSRSMPGSLSSRTRSPLRLGTSSTLGDPDEQASDMSEISSMQSSNCRSGIGNSTTTDSQTSSLIENCTSRLGQDLLRMFLEEISPDVIVEVSGKRFKAHKCILSSRCQYFAGILSGGWVESLGNVIVLPPFSYNVVYFALCHIYSGLATIPDTVSIVELATIADMLGLEGLKEAIMFTLKAKYCHHFHKPCPLCIVGVLECFPLSSVYGLDDLYHKCLKWITKYFSKVWPTKAFATLPTDLLDKCYQHHIVNLTVDNFIDTVYGCGVTAASLQNSRWAESVARMCRRLVNAAAHFAAPRLCAILKAAAPYPASAPPHSSHALHDCLAAAIEWAPPEETCKAYAYLSNILKEIRTNNSKPDLISTEKTSPSTLLHTHAPSWRLQCEGALVRASPRVVTTQAFKDLPSDLRKRLRELGCIKYGAHALPASPITFQDKKPKVAPTKAKVHSSARSIDIAQVRASFVPYAPKPVIPLGSIDNIRSNNDLRESLKKPIPSLHPPKVRTTKAQEERAKFNKTKNTKSQDKLNTSSRSVRAQSFENTKPRYLEPKLMKEKKAPVNKHLPKIESSSESSRNSSPIQMRARGPRGKEAAHTHMSQDSLASSSRPRTAEPSTDSLTDSLTANKYATYTKAHHAKGSVESVRTSRNKEHARSVPNNRTKTKIPVYLNQVKQKSPEKPPKSNQTINNCREPKRATKSEGNCSNKTNDRKVPGSLMNATKSSSAKMVPKVVKDENVNKNGTKRRTHTSRQHQHQEAKEIPAMERSGTFLKDEPTFGETTNIDIDQ